jgi:Galactose-3-O-sulfotransferase
MTPLLTSVGRRNGADRYGGRQSSSPCIVFLHLPKTAGKTLTAALRYKYPSETLFLDSLNEPLEKVGEVPLEDRASARVVTGHLHYGVHRYIPQPSEYVTMLRDPVARVLSMYRFIAGNPRHWFHDDLVRQRIGLEQFVQEAADPGVDNLQTRLIAGRDPGRILARAANGRPARKQPSELDEGALEDAKRNLEAFLVVGLTERFDESFILLRRALGWKLPMYETHNVSKRPRSESATPEALELIRDRNRLDLELYDHARELFSAAVEREGASFRREVAAFKALNRIPNTIGPLIPTSLRRPLRSLLPR